MTVCCVIVKLQQNLVNVKGGIGRSLNVLWMQYANNNYIPQNVKRKGVLKNKLIHKTYTSTSSAIQKLSIILQCCQSE